MDGSEATRVRPAGSVAEDWRRTFRDHPRLWLVIDGAFCVIAGSLFLVVPNRAVALLAVVLGLGLLFAAGWLVVLLIDARGSTGVRWGVLVAVVAFIAGVLVLAYPTVGAVVLVVLLTVWLLVTGVLDLVAGARGRHRGSNVVLGLISVVVALSLVIPPLGVILTDGVLLIVVGVGLVVRGIMQLVRAAREGAAGPHRRHRAGRTRPPRS